VQEPPDNNPDPVLLTPVPTRRPIAADPVAVRSQAQVLHQAALAGEAQPLLRGKKLGLLCEDDQAEDALLFRRAADRLGAHVAHIRPSLCRLGSADEVLHTARMLGRLYDAVECQGMAPGLVRQIGLCADVPVFDRLAGEAESLDDGATGDLRSFLLQALLLQALT
jgi:ornithine carbamoyltransferase